MPAQTWKTHWANIDQTGDPQHYVGQMAAIRKQHEEKVDIPRFLTFCDLQVGERVLDVGCGTGWHVRVASRNMRALVLANVPVVGVEPERNELERIFLEVTKGEVQ